MPAGFLRADRWALSDRAALGMAVMVVVGWTFHTLWNPPTLRSIRVSAAHSGPAAIAATLRAQLPTPLEPKLVKEDSVQPAPVPATDPAPPTDDANLAGQPSSYPLFITQDETAITMTYAIGVDGRAFVTGFSETRSFATDQQRGTSSITTLQFMQAPLRQNPSQP